jgi:two-component system, response regulator
MNENYDILLVEDNPADAELAIRALRKSHIANSLLHLEDGEAVLNYVFCTGQYSERKMGDLPKLILLDLKMPRVSGLEVLQQIKSDERTKKIPVVLLTSSKEESDISNGYKAGVNSYIVKPVEFESFVKAVSETGLYWLILNQPPQ